MENPTLSLTIKSTKGIATQLQTSVEVFPVGTQTQGFQGMGIWDTGATGSVITKNVADALGLLPINKKIVHTANGPAEQNVYLVNIGLPNRLMVTDMFVTEAPLHGCDVLIGMDIISLGDFSITNFNDQTCMSFRVPSKHEIDYVQHPTMNAGIITHGGQVNASTAEVTPPPKPPNMNRQQRREWERKYGK